MKSLHFSRFLLAASCVITSILVTKPSSAQDGWTAQESGTTLNLWSPHFIDEMTGWVVGGTIGGGGNIILHTTDGGETWDTQLTGTGTHYSDVFFVDANNGWVTGMAGTILHTTDGGQNWIPQTSNDPHNLFIVHFVDINNGWIGGDWQTLLHTTNGGETWLQQTVASYRGITAFSFIDSSIGWAAGTGEDIFHTIDGGGNWILQNTGSTSRQIGGLSFVDALNGWASVGNWGAAGGGSILHTSDGGASWVEQSTGIDTKLNDVFFADANNGWVQGGFWDGDEDAVILKTTDGGLIWQTQLLDPTFTVSKFSFINSTTAWSAGSAGTILHTTTGGNSPPPSEEPIAYWPFNGNADDESGNDRHGTPFGPTLATDRFGQPERAYYFSGDSTYIKASGVGLPTGERSVSLWFLAESVLGRPTAFSYGGSTCGHSWMQGINHRGEEGFTVTSHCTLKDLTVEYLEEPTGEWHHWVVKTSTLGTRMFVDGVLIGENGVYFDDTHTYQGDVAFGTGVNWEGFAPFYDNNTGWFVGYLDDIRIYDRAITEAEILELYNELPPDPLAQYGVCYGTTGSPDTTNAGALITIDPITGAGTLIGLTGILGSSGPAVSAVAIKSTGEMYVLSQTPNSDLYTVNASTGEATFVANTGLLFPGAIVFDKDDVLYAVDNTENLYTVDEVTGVRTVVGPTGVLLGGLAYDPTDGTMYGSTSDDNVYTIDVTTGLATLVGATGLGGNLPDLHFDQDGNLFGTKRGAGNDYDYISIDKTTGAGTIIGSTGFWAVIGLATRLDPPASTIPCFEISRFQSRCQSGGTIQARVILTSSNYEGEIVEFTIDDTLVYSVTVNSNQRASLSVGVFDPGTHTVALTDPPGCFDPIAVRCRQGIAMEGDFWENEESWEVPVTTSLFDNFPNPFNPSTTIRYGLSQDAHVTIKVYNIVGQLVNTLADDFQPAGYGEVVWDGRNEFGSQISSGMYIYRMTAGGFVETKKMLFMK